MVVRKWPKFEPLPPKKLLHIHPHTVLTTALKTHLTLSRDGKAGGVFSSLKSAAH